MPKDRPQSISIDFWIFGSWRLFHALFKSAKFDVTSVPADDFKPESLKQSDDFLPRQLLKL